MKIILATLSFLLLVFLQRVASKGVRNAHHEHAVTPPRGWNSYDSFCWTISEEEFLQNAELVSHRLNSHGYEYVVVDYLWYRRKVSGASVDSLGFDVIDEWGRMAPDPDRWPSSKGGKGFSEVAKKVHDMGLKFGIHVMRGISTQAVNANSPILDTTKGGAYMEGGRKWTASDVGIKERACTWMSHGFMSVNTKLGAGRAFLRSLYEQYAEWGVDFVKHDCVFGEDLDIEEITFVSEVLRQLSHPILYSLSPGTSVTPAMAKAVSGLANMYRITGDDWDNWADVASHFDVSRDFAAVNMIGSGGLLGRSWPDLDMLPLGFLTDAGSNEGPHRKCNLNIEEQKTQMTLWAMAKSPIMFGGDMRNLDNTTYNLITNPTILEINTFSSNNKEFHIITSTEAPENNQHRHITSQRGHTTKGGDGSHTNSLTLMNCEDTRAKGWAVEAIDQDFDQVCWKNDPESHLEPFCLYKRKLRVSSGEELVDETHNHGRAQLLATRKSAICLGASPKQRLTSKENSRGSLSACKRDANQMWKLDNNGALVNSYSGLCARVQNLEDNAVPGGIRSWVATGRRGEIYVAFFNLEQVATTMSTQLSNMAGVLPGVKLGARYKCIEIWSGQECRISEGSISVGVHPHGAALLVLTRYRS